MESLSFIQKIKVFNIFNARQLVSVYYSHVESLGNFKNKYKTKKEKVRNQTTYITKFSKRKREGDGQRRRRKKGKKKKQLPHGATPTSSSSSSFSPSFCFLSLQMRLFMFQPGIHLPTETAGFRLYNRYTVSTIGIFSETK